MKLKKRLEWEEHRDLGNKLYEVREFLIHQYVRLANTYGSSSVIGRQAERALKEVDKLRSDLDDRIGHEHPERGDHPLNRVYYGPDDRIRVGLSDPKEGHTT